VAPLRCARLDAVITPSDPVLRATRCRHVVPHHGPEILLGGHSWLISALVLVHMLLVVMFWLWLFWKSRMTGKTRRKPRQKPTEMHVSYAWTEERGKDRML
jgi:hypothetical protein